MTRPLPCTFPPHGRPRLLPEVALAWRSEDTLQLGTDERTGRMFSGLGAREERALRALDGTRTLDRAEEDFVDEGGIGLWLRCAVDDLLAAGLLVDADGDDATLPRGELARLGPELAAASWSRPGQGQDVLARRRRATVLVRGTGRVGVGVGALLSAAGVGTVRVSAIVGDSPRVLPRAVAPLGPSSAMLGQPAAAAARSAVAAASFGVRTRGRLRGQHPDAVVICPPRVVAPMTIDRLLRAPVPVLAAVCDGAVARVGPLVLPGLTSCLRCLDLHRADRDPAWPLVLAQVAHQRQPHRSATDTTLATLTAATAALQVLTLLDDPEGPPPPSAGTILELRVPGLTWESRCIPPHPDCGCLWAPAG